MWQLCDMLITSLGAREEGEQALTLLGGGEGILSFLCHDLRRATWKGLSIPAQELVPAQAPQRSRPLVSGGASCGCAQCRGGAGPIRTEASCATGLQGPWRVLSWERCVLLVRQGRPDAVQGRVPGEGGLRGEKAAARASL